MFGKKLKTYDYDAETLKKFQYAKIKTNKGDIWVKPVSYTHLTLPTKA